MTLSNYTTKPTIWAVIPARAGSKRFPNKNISELLGIPLLVHSIKFAKKLSFIDKILLSTDSKEYASLGKEFGAEVPFLRGKSASTDTAMEEDIIEDIRKSCLERDIDLPYALLWLRPTHPLRCVKTFEKAFNTFVEKNKSVCIVVEDDSRLFIEEEGNLRPVVEKFRKKSMVRRQDSPLAYRIFSGEIFVVPKDYNPKFLGDDFAFCVQPSACSADIDDSNDLEILDIRISLKKSIYEQFLHND